MSRRRSNGASPLVNPQRQITSFFTKATSSPSQSPLPKSKPSPSPTTPSPLQSKPSNPTPEKSYGQEVVGKRIKVFWPSDRTWYEGCVKLFNKENGRHLLQYDDGDEETLDLERERIEWVQETVLAFKRLRRGPLSSPEAPVAVAEEKEETVTTLKRLRRGSAAVVVEDKEESNDDGDDDSEDEDWGKSVEKEVVEEKEEDEVMKLEDEEDSEEEVPKPKGKRGGGAGKRKSSSGGNSGSAKKTKTNGNVATNGLKANFIESATNAESK